MEVVVVSRSKPALLNRLAHILPAHPEENARRGKRAVGRVSGKAAASGFQAGRPWKGRMRRGKCFLRFQKYSLQIIVI